MDVDAGRQQINRNDFWLTTCTCSDVGVVVAVAVVAVVVVVAAADGGALPVLMIVFRFDENFLCSEKSTLFFFSDKTCDLSWWKIGCYLKYWVLSFSLSCC